MKIKLIKDQRLLFTIIFALSIGLVLFYLFFIRPLALEEVKKRDELQRLEISITELEAAVAELKQQTITGDEKARLSAAIPERPMVEQVIRAIVEAEKQSQVTVEGITVVNVPDKDEPTQVEEEDVTNWQNLFPETIFPLLAEKLERVKDVHLSYVDVILDVVGNETGMDGFVKQLEESPRIVHIQNYSIQKSVNTSSQVEATIGVRVYYTTDFESFLR